MGLEQFDTILAFTSVLLIISLLVTIGVQMIVAMLGLRGRNLQWGVQRLLEQFDPALGLAKYSQQLTEKITHHPALVYTRRAATAIRPGELITLLEDIARKEPGGDLKTAIDSALEQLVPSKTVDSRSVRALTHELLQTFPSAEKAIHGAASKALATRSKVELEVETWFNTVMDRSTERFVLHTRWITAIIATVACFVLHIDSLSIFEQLSSNAALRGRIVEQSGALADETAVTNALLDRNGEAALATQAIKAMKEELPAGQTQIVDSAPANLVSRTDGQRWLESKFDETLRRQVVEIYNKQFDAVTKQHLEKLGTQFDRAQALLTGASLAIVPAPRPCYVKWWCDEKRQPASARHFFGVLVSAMFLALGAPFWFNLLKQLTALRPIIANKIDKDKQVAQQALINAE